MVFQVFQEYLWVHVFICI
uniref:Uncharacterized protein n=1 Tax=Anguilla anguilla TaxID=7936 RepID=A0A0E9V029_ANGAN